MPYVIGSQFEQLPPWYQTILRNFIEQTESLRQQQYPQYQGERIAELPPTLLRSQALAGERGRHEPYYQQAQELLGSTRGVPYRERLAPYLNPYIENVVSNIGKKGQRLLKENILPQLEAQFVRLGQHGSSRHKDLALRAARDLEEAILEKQEAALARGYEQAGQTQQQERLREIEQARSLGQLGSGAQQEQRQQAGLLNLLGGQEQAHRQNVLNEQQAEFWRRQMWPQQNLAQQAATLHGIPQPPGTAYSTGYTPPQAIPTLSPLGQAGGIAAQLYGFGRAGGFKKGGKIKENIPLSALKFKKKSAMKKR
jgi:hypothetical protein